MIDTEYTALEQEEWEEEDEIQIDWIALLAKWVKNWKFIGIFTVIFAILGVFVALRQTKLYTSIVTLTPEYQMATSRTGSLSSLTSMLGVNMSAATSADALNIRLFPDIANSTPFLTQLFDIQVQPDFSERDKLEGKPAPETISLFDFVTKAGKPKKFNLKKWVSELLGNYIEIPEPDTISLAKLSPKQLTAVALLRRAIKVEVDAKTGMTTIEVTLDDPWITTQVADSVCQKLQDFIIDYRIKKGTDDLKYYTKMSEDAHDKLVKAQSAYARSVDFDRSVILQSVNSEKERLRDEVNLAAQLYNQMEMQKEQALAKIQEAKPVFAVVQPASYPIYPSSRSRKVVVLLFMFVGFVFASVWAVVLKDFIRSFKNNLTEKIKAE